MSHILQLIEKIILQGVNERTLDNQYSGGTQKLYSGGYMDNEDSTIENNSDDRSPVKNVGGACAQSGIMVNNIFNLANDSFTHSNNNSMMIDSRSFSKDSFCKESKLLNGKKKCG
jgi:hypothetical protein